MKNKIKKGIKDDTTYFFKEKKITVYIVQEVERVHLRHTREKNYMNDCL